MRVFIAMPFAPQFDESWTIINEVCEENELKAFRIDKNLSYERHIDIAIQREIETCDFMVAVLTGDNEKLTSNPNVTYEVGYAQGIQKETILLAENIDNLPFDLKHQRTCLYSNDMSKLKASLTEEIKLMKKKLYERDVNNMKNFGAQVERCLRLIMPQQYRMFNRDNGLVHNKIFSGIYFYNDKYFVRHGFAIGENNSAVETYCWLGRMTDEDEMRQKLRSFLAKHNEEIRGRLGTHVTIHFEESSLLKSTNKQYEFIHEPCDFSSDKLTAGNALEVAVKLRYYAETLQPLVDEFLKQENIYDSLKPKYVE